MRKRNITILSILLYPFSLIYGSITGMRNLMFDWGLLREKSFNLPVISVGNINVGGTGKTPHVEYLIELLKEGFSLATLSRGYMRKTRNFMIATSESSASEIGDEPRQLKQKFPDILVAVDRKRVNGIEQILKLADPIDVILLDDAFQHRYVKPGKSILLIDYHRMINEDFLLPAGRLRESGKGKKRADIILITKSPERIKPIEMRNIVKKIQLGLHQHLFFTTIEYGSIMPVFKNAGTTFIPGNKNATAPLLILSGIANPRPIRKYARSISNSLHEMKFPDHHAFTAKDMQKIKARYQELNHPDALIITTEKDAMRLQELNVETSLQKVLYYVPIKVKFLNNDADEFNKLIINYVRSNKRDNILYQRENKTKA